MGGVSGQLATCPCGVRWSGALGSGECTGEGLGILVLAGVDVTGMVLGDVGWIGCTVWSGPGCVGWDVGVTDGRDVLGGLHMGCGTLGRWEDGEDVLVRLLLGWRTLGPWKGLEREECGGEERED